MEELLLAKQFCLDNCILSGCNPKVINATLFYLKHFKTYNHMNQESVSEQFGVSTVALRNNVHKIQRSKHYEEIKKLIGNEKIARRC